jgi:murein DD-endopeptidase MepM/ murein hydrolase activator NlpD
MHMKKFDFSKFSGKGLAIAVFVCLLAVGGAGIYSYSKVQNSLDSALMSSDGASQVTAAEVMPVTVTTAPVTKISSSPDINVDASQNNIPVDNTLPDVPIVVENPTTTAPTTDVAATVTSSATVDQNALPTATACVRPVNGEIINGFSGGELVKSKTLNVWKTHDGIDISAAAGDNVKSMTSGTVSEVYVDQLMGVTVVIDHGNGLIGYYCNLNSDVPVAEGDKVSAGTVIGTIGSTADSEVSEDPHLHFALKKNNAWIDPAALLSGSGS